MGSEGIPIISATSDNPTWQRFMGRFRAKKVFGGMVIPDPEEIAAEATRLRADPNAVQNSADRLNDPQVLEAIANRLRTLIQESELAQVAAKSKFPEDSKWQLIQAGKTYESAVRRLLGTEDERTDESVDKKA